MKCLMQVEEYFVRINEYDAVEFVPKEEATVFESVIELAQKAEFCHIPRYEVVTVNA